MKIRIGIKNQYDPTGPKIPTSVWRKIFVFGSFILLAYGLVSSSAVIYGLYLQAHPKAKIVCGTFEWQEEAQAIFNSSPTQYKNLDKGGIKNKACEHLPSKLN